MTRPADFDVITAHCLSALDAAHWDALCGAHPFSSYRWHQFGEQVLHQDVPCYILLLRAGQPVARASFWITRQEVLPIDSVRLRTLAEVVFRRWPLMFCRAPLAPAPGVILPADEALHLAALEAISDAARSAARQHGASFIIFDYLEAPLTGLRTYSSIEMSEPGTTLDITWTDFDAYLSSLKKSAYKDYRRHVNRAADLEVEVTALHLNAETPVPEPDIDAIVALIQNVDRSHGTPSYPFVRRALTLAHHSEATFLAARIGERLVGCGLMIGDGDQRLLSFLGLDYDVQYVYFQLFYAAIRAAIESGVKTLWGGSGAYEYKERLGFVKQCKTTVAFTASNRVIGRVMQTLLAS